MTYITKMIRVSDGFAFMWRAAICAILLGAGAGAGTAMAQDIQVSRYVVSDPLGDIYRGADVIFAVDVENGSATPVTDGVLTIDVPSTMVVLPGNIPGICTASGPVAPQTLTCILPTLVRDSGAPDFSLSFVAEAQTAGAQPSTATVSSATATDTNLGNNALTITPTISSGADVSITSSAPASVVASERFSFDFAVANAGPDPVSEVTVAVTLPVATSFGYVQANGSGWSCTYSAGAASASCVYSGAAIAPGGSFPLLELVGDADVGSGTLTALADVTITQSGLGDPAGDNNVSLPATANITPGTDLRGIINLPAALITGETATLTLSVINNGPSAANNGASVVHELPAFLALDGPLPAGCSQAGQVLTCSVATLGSGVTEAFAIPVRAVSDTGGPVTVTATSVLVGPQVDPISGNDTGSDTFRIDDPAADLRMRYKSKSPNPVQAGGTMRSTIALENEGPSVYTWTPTNPITVHDDLTVDETYLGVTTAGWSCTTGASPRSGYTTRVTCVTTDTGSLAIDSIKLLRIETVASPSADSMLTNFACYDPTSSLLMDPNPSDSSNCRSRGARATTTSANLSLQADVSLSGTGGFSGAINVPSATDSHFIRLQMANDAGSPDAARTAIVTADLANWLRASVNFNGGTVNHLTGVSVFFADPGVTCGTLATANDNLRCEATNLLPGETRTVVLQVDRAILTGLRTTNFSLNSPDTIETNTSDNSDSVDVTADPTADVIVDNKTLNPSALASGAIGRYEVSVVNLGPNNADDAVATDFVDPALFEVISVTGTGGATCDYGTTTANTATCSFGALARNSPRQMNIEVRPIFPFNGAASPGDYPVTHTNTASVTTTTLETDGTNNSRPLIHTVTVPALDLQVFNTEPAAFVEPSVYGAPLLYEVRSRNGAGTQATGVTNTVTPVAPAGYGMLYDPAASILPPGVSCSQAAVNDPVVCTLPDLADGEDVTNLIAFQIIDLGAGDPSSSLTFSTTAVLSSDQNDYDGPPANNTATQNTTVIPSTDLEVVSKTRALPIPPAPVNIAEPVSYDIVFRNNGGSDTTQVRIVDTLPAGFELTAMTPVSTPSGAASVSATACTGTTIVTCVIDGVFPATGDLVTLRLQAAAVFPFTGNLGDPIVNSAEIQVGQTSGGEPLSVDEVSGNNTGSVTDGILQVSSISGTVYSDDDQSDSFDSGAGEAITGVDVTLSGTDLYGNAVSVTVATNASGVFTFADIPPSDGNGYDIVQAQPAGFIDYQETAGSSGGVVDNANFGPGAATNTISGIVLGEDVDATGYFFAEYTPATVTGAVYSDLNNNGLRDGTEAGIAPACPPSPSAGLVCRYANTPHVSLTGTNVFGATINLTADLDASGAYIFNDVPPSDGAGYTVVQLEEPAGFLDGNEQNGQTNSVITSINGAESITLGGVGPGDALSDMNFGHVLPSTLSGVVYIDANSDGLRQGGETSTLDAAVVELSGIDDLGAAVSCTVTTGADGAFSFPTAGCDGLRPGVYDLNLTASPGNTPTGVVAGSAGGTAAVSSVTAIMLTPDVTGLGYDFGVNITPIDAVLDDFTAAPIVGLVGGDTATIFGNDTLNTLAIAPTDVTVTLENDGGLTGVSISSDGVVTVPAGTAAGPYTVGYEICESGVAGNCDQANILIVVTAATIVADNNDFTATPINGFSGGDTPSVFDDDRLNSSVFTPSEVTATLTGLGGVTGAVINPDGTVSIPAGTPAGTYTLDYTICEVLNPANCDPAQLIVQVDPPVIEAVDNDFTSEPIDGRDGGDTLTIFSNDTLNAVSFSDADVVVTVTADGGLTGASIHPDGTLRVPPGTPAGPYTVSYEICEVLNPTNCDAADILVVVAPTVIDAVDNDFTGTPVGGLLGGITPSVFDNDTLNTSGFPDADVTVTLTDLGGLNGATINPDGTINVAPLTPAGSYNVTYEICETLNPSNCDMAIATVVIEPPTILALDNDFTSTPINGLTGGDTPSIIGDDTLNGSPFAIADVTATLTDPGTLTGVVLNPDGTLAVPPGTAAGLYTVEYEICEGLNPLNCDIAVATVVINPPAIDAVDNDFTPTPINGLSGGSTPSVFDNDTLNGAVFDPSAVTVALTDLGGLTGAVINPDGTLDVPPGSPAGTYVLTYELCEVLNPANCDTATVTLVIEPPAIDAVDNDFTDMVINGLNGGVTSSVFDNDTLNGVAFDPADVTVTVIDEGDLMGAVINPDGTLTVPQATPFGTYVVTYEICEVLNPTNCDTATAIVDVITTVAVSGIVYLDENGDGTFQPGEDVLSGYRVEIRVDGETVATTTTDDNGYYEVTDLDPTTDVQIVFIDPDTGTVAGIIDGVDLTQGSVVVDQNLPLDPSGVVYNFDTGEPIVGALVTLTDANGVPLPDACFVDASQQGQATNSNGFYRFGLVPGAAPACPVAETEYVIRTQLPGNLPIVFGFNPQSDALDLTTCPGDAIPGGRCQVFADTRQPGAGVASVFYTSFLAEAGDSNLINNHIPVNFAATLSPLTVTKRAQTATASVGSPLVYTITVNNNQAVDVVNTDVIDDLPVGFKYVVGSSRVDGIEREPVVTNNRLVWDGIDVPANTSVTINIGAVVGAGVRVGDYVNTVFVETGPGELILSNIAEATVRITPDEVFDCSELIGKVFEDTNGNGIQDDGEDGLGGIRLATARGLLVETDEFGRYHIACAATPKPGIGSNFIIKLDERTLPSGFSVATENPRVVRLTQGKMTEANFGASMIRVVRMDLTTIAFDGLALRPEWQGRVDEVVAVLAEERSILKLSYIGDEQGAERLNRIAGDIRARWEDVGNYELQIQTQALSASMMEGEE